MKIAVQLIANGICRKETSCTALFLKILPRLLLMSNDDLTLLFLGRRTELTMPVMPIKPPTRYVARIGILTSKTEQSIGARKLAKEEAIANTLIPVPVRVG